MLVIEGHWCAVMEIEFTYERDRASQAVLWLLHRHGGSLDKLKLVKLVFLADREHLARYGRPVVGGCYFAMLHGPVCSELLDDINQSGSAAPPSGGPPFNLHGTQVQSRGPATEEMLSESDIEILHEVDRRFGQMDPFRLRDYTHSLKVWQDNYQKNTSIPIPYEDFFLDLDPRTCEMLKIIREDQETRRVLDE